MGGAIGKKLTEAGYKMLGDNQEIEDLILDILETNEIRYLKAIPFLLYKYDSDVHNIYKKTRNKALFNALLNFSQRIFFEFGIDKRLPNYAGLDKNLEKDYAEKFNLNFDEFRGEFDIQLRNEIKPPLFLEKQKIFAERDLQMNLSKLFTKKEREIIRRLMEDKPISRTDYECYSRKTKKKLSSIMGLQDLAKTIYTKNPVCDDDLFKLKKKLEEWLEMNSNEKKISILKFFVWDEDKISIIYEKLDNKYNSAQLFNTNRNINEIKDNEILSLLSKYKEHNFR